MTEKNRIVYETLMKVKDFTKGVSKVQAGFKKLSNLAGAFATGFMGSQLLTMFQDWANEAGKLETVNRSFARSFGSLSTEVSESLSNMGETIGRNVRDLKQGAVAFNSFFKGLGFARKESAELSTRLQGLSLDLASFFGMSDQAAQKRFIAALAGSPEVLDQFGINLKQAALEVELLNRGIKTSVQTTSEMEKTHARLAIIMKAMTSSGVIGDAEEAVNTYAGKMKQFTSTLTELKETIGGLVIPVLTHFMEVLIGIGKIVKTIGVPFRYLIESLDKARAERLDKDLKNIKVTQKLINGLQKEMLVNEKGLEILGKEKFHQYVRLAQKIKEISIEIEKSSEDDKHHNDLLNDKRILRTQLLELGQEIQEGLVKISQEEKLQLKIQEEYLSNLEAELKLIDEKFKRKRQLESFEGKSVADLLKLKEQHEEIALLLGSYHFDGRITTERYQNQLDILIKINKELKNSALLERHKARQERDTSALDIKDKFTPLGKGILDREIISGGKVGAIGTTVTVSTKEAVDTFGIIVGLGTKDQQKEALSETMKRMSINASTLIDTVKAGTFKKVRQMSIDLQQMLQPFVNALNQVFEQMLTPPDATLSKEEQKEKTKEAFAGIIVGLGQAMMAIGQGMILTAIGLQTLIKEPIVGAAIGAAMIGTGAILVKHGKGKLQNIKNAQHARNGGGTANAGGGVGGFGDFMNAIQGEQVFRLAGNDLVTAINRTNRFQGTIGG